MEVAKRKGVNVLMKNIELIVKITVLKKIL